MGDVGGARDRPTVPEPGTMALMALGLLCLFIACWRKPRNFSQR